ncbi:hypothetical protein BVE84_08265 [Streptococcus azizii]|uniref:Uncharacterized protein n=1 Tax=Streptococcus azizii TaxID=1579424 RepID=A0AB36JM98_9STRE|nr:MULTISPECIES: hypothetical protein [Streptococcus]MBF0776980.1 hypothetical protein [Streptococcus sp. 19428wD3_AN2]ONK25450.1 hypothetical protein BVE86_10265 [Streptococcus azizii]ONK25535.1 hypothetical protein BVE85_09940 [Streptococcus azizii]ONK27191.1 hypothetical protein BVE84_08265 [Streptococcus azizii]TFU81974.1 hypothetical protein E4T83_09525 [Streptococcus sp. AN2]
MTEAQRKLLIELKVIQEQAVAMNSEQPNLSEKEKLFNVSYDTLYLVMELLDGYRHLNIDLLDKDSHEFLNNKIQLHDEISNFLKSY